MTSEKSDQFSISASSPTKMERIKRSHLNFILTSGTVLLVIGVLLSTEAFMLPVPLEDELTPIVISDINNDSAINSRTFRSTSEEESLLPSYRLKKSVFPEKYFLTISPILEAGFEDVLGAQWSAPGSVVISVEAVKPGKSITLHSKNITIHNVTVFKDGGDREEMPVRNVSHHQRHSFMTIHLAKNLVSGVKYEISINFTAYVSEELNGLFRSNYRNDETGQTEWFAATHFEAIHARQMYPCFDEPSYKAIIQAKIGRQQSYVALFNTESTGNETMQGVDGWVWETFAPTVKMSTYLTALVVAKFQYAESAGKLLPNTRVRTYAPPHFVVQDAAQYAADMAERILFTYGEYFKQPYPMKKFDSVAVPSFLYGAMENYGLSIFRETLLLNFVNRTTETARYVVTNVICHELGHQWFGNLVSPKWWTHLWLSEGLTKFTEYIGLNATVPEFHPWDIFVSESLQLGLRLDADQRISHSLKIDEDSWPMKGEMDWFDDIAYKKGGSLIRMMQGFLTEPILKKGLSRYLARLKYQAAVQDDLFMDCDKEAQLAHKLPENTTLKHVMSGWTLQSGFPLLMVKIEGTSGSKGALNKIRVSQEKYVASRSQRMEEAQSTARKPRWYIPVSVATSRHPNFDPQPEFWIRNNETSVEVTLPVNSWVILNAGTTGFYRVLYDEELSNRITDQLIEHPFKIDRLARSQLMDDYFNAVWNRYIPIERALNFTRYMKDHAETEHVVWTSVLSMLKTAFRLFKDNHEDFDSFKGYMLPRIEKAIEATGGYNAVDLSTKGMPVIRHAQLLDWACSLESPKCLEHAVNQVKLWKSTGHSTIPRDFRTLLLSAAVSKQDDDDSSSIFDFILEQYKAIGIDGNNDDGHAAKRKDQYLTALANTRDSGKIQKLLDMAFQPGAMNSESDGVTLLQNLASNVVASDIILQYFVDNHVKIMESFGGSTSPITITATAMAPHLKSLSGLFLIEQLVQRNETMFKNSFSPVINRIRANIIWYDDFGEDMLEFFDQHK